jgi:hypothetical protein
MERRSRTAPNTPVVVDYDYGACNHDGVIYRWPAGDPGTKQPAMCPNPTCDAPLRTVTQELRQNFEEKYGIVEVDTTLNLVFPDSV